MWSFKWAWKCSIELVTLKLMHWKGAKIVTNDRSNVAGANSRVWLDKSLVGSGGVT